MGNRISIKNAVRQTIPVNALVNRTRQNIPVNKAMEVHEGDPYTGEYTAIPAFYLQTFETADKLLAEDFKVTAIPRYDVDNAAGGITTTIGLH